MLSATTRIEVMSGERIPGSPRGFDSNVADRLFARLRRRQPGGGRVVPLRAGRPGQRYDGRPGTSDSHLRPGGAAGARDAGGQVLRPRSRVPRHGALDGLLRTRGEVLHRVGGRHRGRGPSLPFRRYRPGGRVVAAPSRGPGAGPSRLPHLPGGGAVPRRGARPRRDRRRLGRDHLGRASDHAGRVAAPRRCARAGAGRGVPRRAFRVVDVGGGRRLPDALRRGGVLGTRLLDVLLTHACSSRVPDAATVVLPTDARGTHGLPAPLAGRCGGPARRGTMRR